MSESNESQRPFDVDLRTRIKEEVLDGILSMFSENDSVEMAAGYIADAVIRELGLRQETRHAVVPHVGIVTITPETFTTAGDHRQETRYVTEWTADD